VASSAISLEGRCDIHVGHLWRAGLGFVRNKTGAALIVHEEFDNSDGVLKVITDRGRLDSAISISRSKRVSTPRRVLIGHTRVSADSSTRAAPDRSNAGARGRFPIR
jgi:hypothetical protein